MKKLVINIITLRASGDYGWWDEFPLAIYERLRAKGIDYLACYRGFSDRSRIPEEIRCFLSHKECQNPFVVWWKFRDIVKRYDRIIIHNHSAHGNDGLFVFNNRFNKKCHWITTDHDSWFENKFSSVKRNVRIVLRELGFLPEIIIGCSMASMERLKQIYGTKGITYIYNGADFDYEYVERDDNMRFKGVFCGRMEWYKGIKTLLEAMFLLKERGVKFELDVLGNGGYYEKAVAFVRDNGLSDMVRLHGHIYEPVRYLRNAGIGFMLSEWEENFGLSSLEYQALGIPAIYTNSGGLPEMHINGKTGIMVEKGDAKAVADAVEYLINNPDKWREMSRFAYENSKRFTLGKMADEYVRLYERLWEE